MSLLLTVTIQKQYILITMYITIENKYIYIYVALKIIDQLNVKGEKTSEK